MEAYHRSEILIVGAGIFGTSAAYHLALSHPDPSRITVLDRALFPSPKAASSDINKIVRSDYGSAFYMDLAYEAMDAWASWPLLQPFYHRTGWVMLDERSSDLAERIRRNFKNSGRPDTSSDISLDEVKTRWGGVFSGIDHADYPKAYTNSSAGWADASLAVEALMREAVARGMRYEVGEVSELVKSSGDGLDGLRTSDGKLYAADKILLATGAWTPWLMSPLEDALQLREEERIARQITIIGVCVSHFKLSSSEAHHYGQMPVLIYGAKGEVMPPTRDGLFKFTNANTFAHFETTASGRKVSVPPPERDQHLVPSKLKRESIDLIRQRVPQILDEDPEGRRRHREPDEWRICYDAISPDQNQLITCHPDPRLSNLYFATAGSGHSWKFLPIIGKYIVNVLYGRSNGAVKNNAWKWKTEWSGRGAHEKVLPRRELKDYYETGCAGG